MNLRTILLLAALALCTTGCAHIFACAPDESAAVYDDEPSCVVTLMTEGPAMTSCGPSYADAEVACMG